VSELLKPENVEMVKKSKENFQWFVRHFDELKERYEGKYIAINDGKVIAENVEQLPLLENLDKQFHDRRAILVQYIANKDF
jgi:hypothetical protein